MVPGNSAWLLPVAYDEPKIAGLTHISWLRKNGLGLKWCIYYFLFQMGIFQCYLSLPDSFWIQRRDAFCILIAAFGANQRRLIYKRSIPQYYRTLPCPAPLPWTVPKTISCTQSSTLSATCDYTSTTPWTAPHNSIQNSSLNRLFLSATSATVVTPNSFRRRSKNPHSWS